MIAIARAQRPPAVAPGFRDLPRPFLKWAGGKKQLLAQYWPLFPQQFGRYFEPFLGGGAVFFALQPHNAVLSDTNGELVNAYQCVTDRLPEVVVELQKHRYEKQYYYSVRAMDPENLDKPARAARTIFLNRTGFNGLYRLNKSGQFNVPFGRYSDPKICDTAHLKSCARALKGSHIAQGGFQTVLSQARRGDFVYFDPPYHPRSKTANFTQYVAGGFGEASQQELAETFRALTERGVLCMLSNSDTELIRELYKDFDVRTVWANRAVNVNASLRGKITEVVVLNYRSTTET